MTGRPQPDGFTMVELAVVVVVMSILTRLAMPNVQEALLQARATEALGDLQVVRTAALSYNADTNQWPADHSHGEVPPELVPYLPDGFSFEREEYSLDWENWVLPDGLPRYPDLDVLLGVSITTEREELGNAVAEMLGPSGWYTMGDHYTWLIER